MKLRIRALLFAAAFSGMFAVTLLPADSPLRPPTPAEQKVLSQYRGVVNSILNTFDSGDWDTNIDYEIDDGVLVSATNNTVPLDVDELIQRSYTVKGGSPLYQREIAPFMAKMQSMPPDEMMKAAQNLKMLRLEVQVHFNRAAADPDVKSHQQLQVPGASYSFVSEMSEDKRSHTIVMLFGDWKSAQQLSNELKFRFKHPPHTPVIENLEVQLRGSPDRIHDLLASTDWKKFNEALVPTSDTAEGK